MVLIEQHFTLKVDQNYYFFIQLSFITLNFYSDLKIIVIMTHSPHQAPQTTQTKNKNPRKNLGKPTNPATAVRNNNLHNKGMTVVQNNNK